MKNNLGIIICENFIEEFKYIITNSGIENIMILPFSSKCSCEKNDTLMESIRKCENECNKIIIIGGSCCSNFKKLIVNKENCKLYIFQYCFDLFTNKDIISNFITENLYLVTPGMLSNLDKNNIDSNLVNPNKQIRLLDTGISKDSLEKLKILGESINLPYDSFFVGLDFFRLFIEKIILEWQLECKINKTINDNKISASKKPEKLEITDKFIENKKKQLLYILDSIYEGVFITDQNHKILFINKGVEKLLNLKSFKDILGKNFLDIGLVNNCYIEKTDIILQKVLNNHNPLDLIETTIKQSDGNIIPVNIYSEAIEFEGNPCILTVIRDISEHKKSENLKLKIKEQSELLDKAAEYDKLKTEFFANLSHEFRTPLNVMFSTLQLLNLIGANKAIAETEGKVQKYYHIMKQNCYRLLRLVNNLIDITKIEAEYFKLCLKNENIIAIIEDITLSVTDYAKNKGLDITFDTDIEEKILACEADKIERIMLNLLSNAIKFTPAGGHILVNIKDKDSSIIVSVKDTGTGIPLDNQISIFKRFTQVDKSLSRNTEGSGIGLSLVKSLVELHNGTITLISDYGNGSEFIMEFPVNVLPPSENTNSDENLAKETSIEMINIEFSDIYD